MSSLDVLNKEIDETYKSVSSQHEQVKYYFQIYMAALVGIFTLAGYFSTGGINRDKSIIGIVSTVTVFFLGWVFLSIIAHKVSMLILLYKHLAICRAKRLTEVGLNTSLQGDYVLPTGKNSVRMPNLLRYLPYLVFLFNFLILCGGVAYYLSPHLPYYQLIAITIATAIVFGTPYPVVCLSFNRHIRCALYARNISELPHVEELWYKALSGVRPMSRRMKSWLLGALMLGAVAIAWFSLSEDGANHKNAIIFASWLGVISFSVFRFFVERPELLENLLSPQRQQRTKKNTG